ncbi:MAG: hypothetical protein IPM97_14230 [Bdellovibrionaceae bacterium]|nr:hypothetical protein [Pseudobdellovibrionaceae bacterium]
MLQFQSSKVSFPKKDSPLMANHPGGYSPFLRVLFENIFSWTPSGAGAALSEKCSSDIWSRRLMDSRVSPSAQLQGAVIQKYFRDCGSELETGNTSDIANLLKMMSVQLEPKNHPFWHSVVFNLPGNIKLKGLLALKGDFKRRPLVVMRLGVYSNAQDFLPERPWLMMLFEQAPFNVLVLENMTGSDFVANNSRFAFGGYDEGLQNILVAQILKDPNEPLSGLVESLHLFGISLGGHGVFYASLLNSLNSLKSKPLYQSFITACPVVNLQSTMRNLTEKKPEGYFVDLWSQNRLAGLGLKMPAVTEHSVFGFLDKSVSEVARTYQGGLSYVNSIKLPSGVVDGSDFWSLNNFWPAYKNVSEPVLVLATHKDPAVSFGLNSQMIQSKKLNISSSNIAVVDFPLGIHCTLPISYDWKALGSLTQAYVLSHAPGFKLRENAFELEVGPYASAVNKMTYNVRRPAPKDKFVKIEVKLLSKNGDSHEMSLNLPLAEFDFRFLNHELSPSEQWMIERWVNQNLHLKAIEKDHRVFLKASWFVAD